MTTNQTTTTDLYSLALRQHRQGQLAQAEALYLQLLAQAPEHAQALHMLGQIEFQTGRAEAAALHLEQSVRLQPGNAAAHSDLGVMLQALQRDVLALTCFESAVQLDPTQAHAWNNLGNSLQKQDEYERALWCYEQALVRQPDYAEAYYNRANALQALERHKEAIGVYAQAIRLRPDYPEALNNRSTSLRALKFHEQALENCDAALRLRPDFIDAVNNRARSLHDLERMDEALAAFDHLLQLQPNHPQVHSYLLHIKLKACDWRNYHQHVEHVTRAVAEGIDADGPFGFLSICDSLPLQRQCASTRGRSEFPDSGKTLWRTLGNSGDAAAGKISTTRIKIAYLSSDFRDHPMAHLISELFELHDRKRFEVIGICYGPESNGPVRQRIEAGLDRLINIDDMDDEQAATLMCELGINIAIDLNGFTSHCRTGVLALRPVPVQVNYMGYPGSMGTDYIDYIIADKHLIPEADRRHYSEHVVYLPDSYQANDRQRTIADNTPGRTALRLPEDGFVFCCFNNSYKISPDIFDIWMRLLQQVEGSVLWLQDTATEVPNNLRREAQARGVDPARLVFKPSLRLAEHLSCYRRADLFLDTLPYNAHTTTSDALWAGLPVLTCMGNSFASRVAGSLLHAAGLPELITHSLADYEALALQLARDPQRMAAIKQKLADNRDTCTLFDTPRFCRHIETSYEMMWQRHLRGEAPASFSVPPIA